MVVRDNDPFQAVADGYGVTGTGPLTVAAAAGVRANDVVTRPLSPTAEVVAAPAVGTLVLSGEGSFTYTPPAGFTGTTFTYRLQDGVAVTGPDTVTLRANANPTAVADAYSTDEDTPLTVGLVAPPPAALPLRFGFDEATGPAANGGSLAATGTFAGAAARTAAATIGRSAGAVDLTGAAGGRVSAGDLDALDALTGRTIAVWVRLSATPQVGDVIAQDWDPTTSPLPPAGTVGWELLVTAVTGGVTVSFRLNRSLGDQTQSLTLPLALPAGAVGGWVFLAVRVDPADDLGDPAGAAVEVLAGTPTTLLASSARRTSPCRSAGTTPRSPWAGRPTIRPNCPRRRTTTSCGCTTGPSPGPSWKPCG